MTAWAIKNGKAILVFSIRLTKKDCIKLAVMATGTSWAKIRKLGYSVVKVEIKEVEK